MVESSYNKNMENTTQLKSVVSNHSEVLSSLTNMLASMNTGNSALAIKEVNRYRDADILAKLLGRKLKEGEGQQLLQAGGHHVQGTAKLAKAVQITRQYRAVRALARQMLQCDTFCNRELKTTMLTTVQLLGSFYVKEYDSYSTVNSAILEQKVREAIWGQD